MKKFEIDNFIKDKLAHLQPEFDEQAWDDLEKKLDREDDNRKALLWWWQWDKIAAVFVVGFFGYLAHYLYTNTPQQKDTTLQAKNTKKEFIKDFANKINVSPRQKKNNTFYAYQNPNKSFKSPIKKRVIVSAPKTQPQEAQALTISFDRELDGKMLQNHFSENMKPTKTFTIDSSLIVHQDNNKKNRRKRQSFGVALSPMISPQGLQAGLGYTHEVALSNKVSVLSGINYTPWTSTQSSVAMLGSPSAVNPDVKVKLNTLEIPLEAKVKVAKNVAVSGGVSNTLLLKETIGNVVNNNPELSISSINLGVSYDIKISKNSQLNLQPYYRIPVQSVGLSGTQLSGFGLRTGFSYNTR